MTAKNLAILGAIAAVAVVLRVVFFTGISATDPASYAERAYALHNGTFSGYLSSAHHFNSRFAVFVPVALSFRAFGVSEFAAVLWPLSLFFTTLFFTYKLGSRIANPATGLLAVLFLAFVPLDIRLSTSIVPDSMVTAFMVMCLYAFLVGYEEEDKRKSTILLLLAGFALWGAYSAKLIGGFLVPIVGLYTLIEGRKWKKLAIVYAGFGLLLIPEFLVYGTVYDDVLYRLHAITSGHSTSPAVASANADPIRRLFLAYPAMMLFPHRDFALTFFFIWLGVFYAFRQWRRNLLLLLWFFVVLGYLNFGTSDLSAVSLLTVQGRYLHPVLVPGLILLASAFVDLWQRFRAKSESFPWVRASLATLGVAVCAFSLAFTIVGANRQHAELVTGEMREVVKYLEGLDAPVVYADRRSRRMLRLLSGFENPDSFRVFPRLEEGEEIDDYFDRLGENAVLVYSWREVHNDGPYRERSLRDAERRAVVFALESEQLTRELDAWKEPSWVFYRLASLPITRYARVSETASEFFGAQAETGATLFRVPAR